MSRTVREVIAFLSTMPPETIIAINQIWLKEDAEEFTNEALTDQQWDDIAYYYDNNEFLGDDGNDTMKQAIKEIINNG